MRRLKLHGAFRSGTNYVKALLELNYETELMGWHGGWKHAPPVDPPWPVVGVIREPDTWILALWRYVESGGRAHITCGTTWRSFLRDPIQITHGQRDDIPIYRFDSPFDYWNTMTESLLPHTVVRYEDAVSNPVMTCEDVADRLELVRRREFTPIEYRTRNMVDRARSSIDDYVTEDRFTPTTGVLSFRDRLLVRRAIDSDLKESLRLSRPKGIL